MLGKIINYKIEDNKVIIKFNNGDANVIFINDDIVRFFVNLNNEDYSFAVKKFESKNINFNIELIDKKIVITSKKLIIFMIIL